MEGEYEWLTDLAEIDGFGAAKSVLATWRIVSTESQT
jgi:hypothetical protein